MAWKIRFYSGLNQGVEVPLIEGRVAIGSDPLVADLVVVGSGMAAVQVVLDVSAQGIRLLEWEQGCSPIEAGLSVTEATLLQPLVAQKCGSLLWAYCNDSQAFSEQLKVVGPPRSAPLAGKGLKWAGRLMAGGSVLLLIAIMGLLTESWFVSSEGQSVEVQISTLRTFLREQNLLYVKVGEVGGDGRRCISGYVKDNQERAILQRYLEQHGFQFQLDIFELDDLRQDAAFILNRLGYSTWGSHNAERPGWIKLSGTGELGVEERQHIEDVLKADLPGFLGLEIALSQAPTPKEILDELLEKFHLKGVLTYFEYADSIELSGELDTHQYSQFVDLSRAFKEVFAEAPALKLIKKTAAVRGKKASLVVRYVSLGQVPYIVLEDRQKYPVGAMIPGVGRLLEIAKERLTIGVGAQRLLIDIAEGGRD